MMTNDCRPISGTVYDTATSEMPTIGALTLKTLDMQAETLEMIHQIVNTMWGEECAATPIKPSENLMSRLVAIQENQEDIFRAVKAIVNKL